MLSNSAVRGRPYYNLSKMVKRRAWICAVMHKLLHLQLKSSGRFPCKGVINHSKENNRKHSFFIRNSLQEIVGSVFRNVKNYLTCLKKAKTLCFYTVQYNNCFTL